MRTEFFRPKRCSWRDRRLICYIELRDLWIGTYITRDAIYIVPFPTVVFRWNRTPTLATDTVREAAAVVSDAIHDGLCSCRGVASGLTIRTLDASRAAPVVIEKLRRAGWQPPPQCTVLPHSDLVNKKDRKHE